jgi:hypothetical protein
MRISDLRRSAKTCLRDKEVLGLTVWVAEVPRLEDLVQQTGTFVSQYASIGVCSLAVLLENYEVVPTGAAPHYTVVIPSTTTEVLGQFRDCFLVMPNPLVT